MVDLTGSAALLPDGGGRLGVRDAAADASSVVGGEGLVLLVRRVIYGLAVNGLRATECYRVGSLSRVLAFFFLEFF